MVTKFPEMYKRAPSTELQFGKVPFALYKSERNTQKRSIFLTEHMLIFVINGHKQLHFPDRIIRIDADSVLLIKRGMHVLSEYIAEQQAYECLIVFIPDAFIKRFLKGFNNRDIGKPVENEFIIIPPNDLLNSFKHQYTHYFGKSLSNLPEIMDVKLQELFLLLMSSSFGNQVLAFLRAAVADDKIDLEYVMKQYLLQPMNLSELAHISGRSLAGFKREFQEKYSCSPRKWLNRERLAHATVLLNHTPDTVAQISYSCGFENVSHFIKLYKRQYGYTPGTGRAESVMI